MIVQAGYSPYHQKQSFRDLLRMTLTQDLFQMIVPGEVGEERKPLDHKPATSIEELYPSHRLLRATTNKTR